MPQGQLACGARAFDARPLYANNKLVWHHGDIQIDYACGNFDIKIHCFIASPKMIKRAPPFTTFAGFFASYSQPLFPIPLEVKFTSL